MPAPLAPVRVAPVRIVPVPRPRRRTACHDGLSALPRYARILRRRDPVPSAGRAPSRPLRPDPAPRTLRDHSQRNSA